MVMVEQTGKEQNLDIPIWKAKAEDKQNEAFILEGGKMALEWWKQRLVEKETWDKAKTKQKNWKAWLSLPSSLYMGPTRLAF